MAWWRAVAVAAFVLGGFVGCSGKTTSSSSNSAPAAGKSSGATGGGTAEGGEGGFGAGAVGSGGTGTGGASAAASGAGGARGGSAGGTSTGGAGASARGGAAGASLGGSAGMSTAGGSGGTAGSATSAPPGWTCLASKYGDGKSCDCGCGVVDPDCKDASVGSCDACNVLGGCALGPCPSDIDADDNSRCSLPAGWVCLANEYGNGVCDCGCGALDVDCASQKADACTSCPFAGCAQDAACTGLDPDDNTICTTAPRSWSCDKSLYRDGKTCDCGCGFWDPDCSGRDLGACDVCNDTGSCSRKDCPGTVNATANELCVKGMPPAGWTCTPDSYADGTDCDCGCGLPDPDCDTTDRRECVSCTPCGHCPEAVDAQDPSKCASPPAGWTCPAADYASGSCHCGCGVMDPACLPYMYCQTCVDGCAHGNCTLIDQTDITQCAFDVPQAWTCPGATYGDGVCDCGCGAPDPICKDITKSACGSCNTQGSCSKTPCSDSQNTINPTDNETCL
ncbi:MAG TPA: hypothetical protein VMI54_10580 [Polyangiaceae bacterium]|nr:hypothetical protein [Polyangiaceae bacterium]